MLQSGGLSRGFEWDVVWFHESLRRGPPTRRFGHELAASRCFSSTSGVVDFSVSAGRDRARVPVHLAAHRQQRYRADGAGLPAWWRQRMQGFDPHSGHADHPRCYGLRRAVVERLHISRPKIKSKTLRNSYARSAACLSWSLQYERVFPILLGRPLSTPRNQSGEMTSEKMIFKKEEKINAALYKINDAPQRAATSIKQSTHDVQSLGTMSQCHMQGKSASCH